MRKLEKIVEGVKKVARIGAIYLGSGVLYLSTLYGVSTPFSDIVGCRTKGPWGSSIFCWEYERIPVSAGIRTLGVRLVVKEVQRELFREAIDSVQQYLENLGLEAPERYR